MTQGKFVWHDLLTTEPAEARAFYTGLFGWTAVDVPVPKGTFTMFKLGDRAVGGMVGVEPKEGIPPHWMPYVSVPRLEEALERTRALGGTVHAGPMQAEGVGRWAVVEDPQGGFVSPFETAPGMPAPPDEMMPPVGCFCWEELHTTDPTAAVRFYTGLFGWRAETMPLEPIGPYTMVFAGKDGLGGVMMQAHGDHTAWLSYLRVVGLEDAARKAEGLGGRIVVPPQVIPNIGRFAVVIDPVGASFALFHSVYG